MCETLLKVLILGFNIFFLIKEKQVFGLLRKCEF